MRFISLTKEKLLYNKSKIKDKLTLLKMSVLDKVPSEPKEEGNILLLLSKKLYVQSFRKKISREVLEQKLKTFIFTILENGPWGVLKFFKITAIMF